ncbi:4-aminobutyrate--2-oxoglutarate transaminase [Planococcaceae bacterium Storch 2/2-2]|nr:4-aminobutyrate--2-oxoglutarate transaminase [Planococcaceae bacterium Storch 2/2-2]
MSRTTELQEKRQKYVSRGIGNGNLNFAATAQGSTITDIEGREWIDFAAAIGTLNVGHSHPRVTKVVHEQVDKFLHPSFNVIMYESYIELAEKLSEIAPIEDAAAALFNTGAEAVENAVKFARRYTGRQAVVSFTRGFHGRTNLTMGMTSKVKPYKIGFGPFTPEVYQAPYPYMYRKPADMSDEEYVDSVIAEFKELFVATVAPEAVACVVMEPVQGEGGFIVPPKKFVQEVAAFCKEHGILFVADEIQAGFARTGTMFAIEQFDVQPDLMTLSKSIAGGLPLAAVVGRSDVIHAPTPGEIGGTYSGSPVACVASLEIIDIIKDENLTDRAEEIGARIEEELKGYEKEYDFVGDIRRLGNMVAVELVKDRTTKEPAADIVNAIAKYANDNGLLLITAGIHNNVIRFLTPLVITEEELEKGFAILKDAFESVK